MKSSRPGDSEFRKGWQVVLAALVGIGLGLSPVPFYTIGMFAPQLAREFHWPFARIMAGITITSVAVLIVSPLVGVLADRHGVRKVVLTSMVLFGVSFAAMGLLRGSLVQYYFTWAVIAVGGAGTLPITWTRAVNNRFEVSKGLALGLSMLGSGLFGFFIKPVCAWLIAHEGWRAAYFVIGAMPLGIAFPIAWFCFHDLASPHEVRRPASTPEAPVERDGMNFARTLRDWRFWVIAVAFVPISFAVGGPIPHMENILLTHGFGTAAVAALVPFIGLSVIGGRVIGGWLIDRVWAPGVAFGLLSFPALSCWLLAQGTLDYRTALLCIGLIGFAAGVESDLMAFLVARYFGMRSYATIYGTLYGCYALGAGLAPLAFGAAYDQTHSYAGMLMFTGVVAIVAAAMLLSLGKYRYVSVPPPPGAAAA